MINWIRSKLWLFFLLIFRSRLSESFSSLHASPKSIILPSNSIRGHLTSSSSLSAERSLSNRKCVIVGGCGAFGKSLVSTLREQGCGCVVSIDYKANEDATHSIIISNPDETLESAKRISTGYDAIYCVAGGWTGGNIEHSQEYLKGFGDMVAKNLMSAALASSIPLNANGLMVLTSATASLAKANPSMIAYGVSKVGTNHLIASLASEGSGLPSSSSVVGILPEMLDTPANRLAMPSADISSWTPLNHLSARLVAWIHDKPARGSLIKVVTRNGATTFSEV
jgi:dihydropteridine reductase